VTTLFLLSVAGLVASSFGLGFALGWGYGRREQRRIAHRAVAVAERLIQLQRRDE